MALSIFKNVAKWVLVPAGIMVVGGTIISQVTKKAIPLQIESADTKDGYYSRNNTDNLRCVIDCRMFPKPDPTWVQNQRTYCYSCSAGRSDL